jgi:hypothetical protein
LKPFKVWTAEGTKGEAMGMILGILGILVLGALYGYWIGTVGKRHSWSGKKVKGVAGIPLMVPFNG